MSVTDINKRKQMFKDAIEQIEDLNAEDESLKAERKKVSSNRVAIYESLESEGIHRESFKAMYKIMKKKGNQLPLFTESCDALDAAFKEYMEEHYAGGDGEEEKDAA